jgi:hypothetical protein
LSIRTRLLSTRRSRVTTAVGLVVFLVLAGTSAAQAAWTATASSTNATVSTAAISTTMTNVDALNTTYDFTGTSPIQVAAVTVKNTGAAPLGYTLSVANTLTPSGAALASKIKVSLWPGSTSACAATPPPSALTGTLAALPALPAGANSAAAGAQFVLCVATQLQTTAQASNGQAVTATFTITGAVGTNWKTTAVGTTKQSVAFQIPDVTGIGCDSSQGIFGILATATVSWNKLTTASGYDVYLGNATTPLVKFTSNATTSIVLSGIDGTYVSGAATSVRIVAYYSDGSTSAGITVPLAPVIISNSVVGTECG